MLCIIYVHGSVKVFLGEGDLFPVPLLCGLFFMSDSRSPTPPPLPLYICAKCSMQQAETLFVSGAMLGIEYSSFKITHTWQTFVLRMNYVKAALILSW